MTGRNGRGIGETPLTWSQRHIWLGHHSLPANSRSEFTIVMRYVPPSGASVETLEAALEHLVSRHQALRTSYPLSGPDGVAQRVHPPGGLTVARYDAAEAGTAQVLTAFARTSFELEDEPPLRACVVTSVGVPRQMLIAVHHIAVDDWSLGLLHREFEAIHRSFLAGTVPVLGPVGRRPVDLARWQAGEEGRAHNEAALTYWAEEFRAAPADVFDQRRWTRPGGSHSAALTSPRAATAARKLAERYGVWPSDVYGTAFAAILSAWTGHRTVPVRNYAANREQEWQKKVMACLAQPVPMRLDLTDEDTFATAVTRWARHFERARRHAEAAYDEVVETAAQVARQRHAAVRTGISINYLSRMSVNHGARRTFLTRNSEPRDWAHLGEDAYLRVYDHRDAAVLALNASAEVMADEDVEAVLRSIEALLEVLVVAPAETTLVTQLPRLEPVGASPGGPDSTPDAIPVTHSPRLPEQERVLAAVITAEHSLSWVDLGQDYLSVGGRVSRIPRLRRALADQGWRPPALTELAGTRPLRALAAMILPATESMTPAWANLSSRPVVR